MTNWQTTKASDFCLSVRDGTHDSPKRVNNGKYLITSRHIIGSKIDLTNAYQISNSDYDEVNRRSKVDRWDVLLTMIGTVGEVCLVKDEPNFAIKNIGLFKSKNELFGKWLYYFLQSKKVKQVLDSLKRGTTQEYIPLGELRNLNISYPTNILEIQNIISILSVLDDKIENNHKINETLEEMSCAIFKSWFVDFDPVHEKAAGNAPARMDAETAALFPSSFGDDGLPVDWIRKTLGEVCIIKSGKRPPTKLTSPNNDNEISVYGGNGIAWYTNEILFDQPFIITGRVGTLGTVYRVYEKCWVSDNALCCFPNSEEAFELVYFAMKEVDYQALNSGSTQPLLTQTALKKQSIIAPPEALVTVFHQSIKVLFKKILANNEENQTLSELRDTLLPKLMSGEIRVADAESEVEAAV